MKTEYRAVLSCKQSPCTYCHEASARTFVVNHPDGPFTNFIAARDYGRGMAQKVYGSEHSVTVESREVGEWRLHGGLPGVEVDTVSLRAKADKYPSSPDVEHFVSGRDIRALCDAYDAMKQVAP